MLYKTTLKFLVVEIGKQGLTIPVVSNSYKKTLWLLLHREPTTLVVGVVEGAFTEISFIHSGIVDIPTLHSQILRTTNAIYTAIGKQPVLPNRFSLDYTLPLQAFIIKYSKQFTPDELLVVLGIGHNKLFRTVARLVVEKEIIYIPNNGPGMWSYYDYYWLNEKYKSGAPRRLDIKPFINRSNSQIKLRAHSVGFTITPTKKIVSSIAITLNEDKQEHTLILSTVQRDYMISQISDIVTNIINNKEDV